MRHALVRQSGAVLGTIAGASAVLAGIFGSAVLELRPAALVLLGIWWWTVGKMWIETRALPRPLGLTTAALGALAFAATAYGVLRRDEPLVAGRSPIDPWTAVHAVIGMWLIALSAALYASGRDVPSR